MWKVLIFSVVVPAFQGQAALGPTLHRGLFGRLALKQWGKIDLGLLQFLQVTQDSELTGKTAESWQVAPGSCQPCCV